MARRVSMTRFERRLEQRRALDRDDAAGVVADGTEIRMALIARYKAGELTLEQVQLELKSIQRKAKREGRPTRNDYFKR